MSGQRTEEDKPSGIVYDENIRQGICELMHEPMKKRNRQEKEVD